MLAFRGSDRGNWRAYDWKTLTGIAWYIDDEVLCHAHANGVRVPGLQAQLSSVPEVTRSADRWD